ncbi:lysis protein [Pseudomonas sp. SWRI51]|nr:lysis system i-spanin subunit Rz [Pseudomonas sp. SWRI51]MBC3410087.1 lysis protein [Pseudomonas sp. SWRI51]
MTFESVRSVVTLLLMAVVSWAAWDYKTQLATVRSERDQAVFEAEGLREVARLAYERMEQAADLDSRHTKELNDARQQNTDLQRAVDQLDQRLLVKANCPATTVRTDSAGAGVADAGTAELAADARSDYFTLRDQLALSRQMILGLQERERRFCTTQPNTGATP